MPILTRRFLSSLASPDRCTGTPAGCRGALLSALLLLAPAALIASEAHAQEGLEAEVIGAIRGVGCIIGHYNRDVTLAAAGLSQGEAKPVIQQLLSDGDLYAVPDTYAVSIVLTDELCRSGSLRERLLGSLRAVGCTFGPEVLDFIRSNPRPQDGDVDALALELVAAGEATLGPEGLTLLPEHCPLASHP